MHFLWGKDFNFCHMFDTNFSEHNKIWGAQNRFGGNCPRMPPVYAGLGSTVTRKSSIGDLHVCAGGARHSENSFLIHNMNSICRLCKLFVNIFPQIRIIGS